jgi:hypothetical protein
MKKTIAFLLVGAGLCFVVRNSTFYSVFRLWQGIESGEVDVVMRYADLKRFASLPVDVTVEMAASGMKDVAGTVAESLTKLLGGAVGATVRQIGGQLAENELRARIQRRDLTSLLGGFRPTDGIAWFGGIHGIGESSAILTVHGTCNARDSRKRIETRIGIELTKTSGTLLGFPVDWRATGVEPNSLRTLIRDCALSF